MRVLSSKRSWACESCRKYTFSAKALGLGVINRIESSARRL